MGQRVIYFSDLTNKILEDSRELKPIIVVRHPTLENGPVKLEVSEGEIESIRSSAVRVVCLKLPESNGLLSDTVTIEVEAFNRLAGGREIADVLRQAEPAEPPHKQTRLVAISTDTKPATAPTKEGIGAWPWLASA